MFKKRYHRASKETLEQLKQPLSLSNALEFKKGVIVVCGRGIKRQGHEA